MDWDGKDNVLYLIDLQKDNEINTKELIESVNAKFEEFGLKTRMMMAPDGKDFNPKYMDHTDSYVVIGGGNEIYQFIKEKSPYEFKKYYQDFGNTFGTNPERASMEPYTRDAVHKYEISKGAKTDVIAISSLSTKKTANNLGLPVTDYATFLVLHSAGHNSSINHPNGNRGYEGSKFDREKTVIMNSEDYFYDCIKQKTFTYQYFMNPNNNSGYIDGMLDHFKNNTSRDNYGFNKKYYNLFF